MEGSDYHHFPANFRTVSRRKLSRRFCFRPLHDAELAHRRELPAGRRSHGAHRRLIVELVGSEVSDQPGANSLVNFLDSGLQSPLASKPKNSLDFLERDAIITPIRILDPNDLRVRDHSRDGLSELPDLKVHRRGSHVKNFAGNRIRRRVQARNHRARRVLHVQKRTPLIPVQHRDLPGRRRTRHEQIRNQIEPHPRGKPEQRPESQYRRREIGSLRRHQNIFGIHFRLRVDRKRIHRGSFIQTKFRCPVHPTR
jgi:hypothetical protein